MTLDDDLTRASAQADPTGFLRQNPGGLLAIDEVQRVPWQVLALKLAVDRDPRPGRFQLTGSADLLRLPAMQDSLAGRAENVDLYGFSQGEVAAVRERFVDRLPRTATTGGWRHSAAIHAIGTPSGIRVRGLDEPPSAAPRKFLTGLGY